MFVIKQFCILLTNSGGHFMKKTSVVRQIDGLGRIVVPMDFRKQLNINNLDYLDVSIEEDHITIKKHDNTCILCNSREQLTVFEDKYICLDCVNKIKNGL